MKLKLHCAVWSYFGKIAIINQRNQETLHESSLVLEEVHCDGRNNRKKNPCFKQTADYHSDEVSPATGNAISFTKSEAPTNLTTTSFTPPSAANVIEGLN